MKTLGAYEVLAPLAVGGTAEVFLARHAGAAGVERVVVVKQLLPDLQGDPEFRKMFLDEARLGAKLMHPNVVYTYEMGEADGQLYLALEYLAGLTVGQLAARARQRRPAGLPMELAVAMIRDACLGLSAAHEVTLPDGSPLKLVHRDVSPSNIIATFSGEVKLVDFGIAHAAVREARTRTGLIKGKFAYMSPEQCLGKPIDRRTDVFSLSVVLWELVTGARLFKRKSTYETYQAILRGQVPQTGKDAALDAILMRGLATEVDARYPTAAALAADLDAWLQARAFGATQQPLIAFYKQHFKPEMEAEKKRLAALSAGKSSPIPPPKWEDEESERKASSSASAPGVSGPEEKTAIATGPVSGAPPAAVSRGGWGPLLIFAALVVVAVVVAIVAGALG